MTIRKRLLGRSGIEASEIGLGTGQLGAFREWGGPDLDSSIEIVDEALRLGCTFFDTASPYADGRSEEYLGKALEGRRDQAVICTKFGFWAPGYQVDHSPDRIEEAVELSLRRLRTDYLDVLLFHGFPVRGGTARHWEILRRLVDSGVLRAYGVSLGPNSSETLRRAVDETGSQVVELAYNPLRQEPALAFQHAAEAGVGLVVNVPLEAGWLSGKYDAEHPPASEAADGGRDVAQCAALASEFGGLLPEGVGMAHGALRYILAQQEVSAVIPGAKSVAQVRANMAAGDASLPAETVGAIRRFGESAAVRTWW
jgi:aryl-alcohol dehydrogenase-like predicted oxidoreductase